MSVIVNEKSSDHLMETGNMESNLSSIKEEEEDQGKESISKKKKMKKLSFDLTNENEVNSDRKIHHQELSDVKVEPSTSQDGDRTKNETDPDNGMERADGNDPGKEHKGSKRREKKLMKKRREYEEEKELLSQKLEDTKRKFQEEINKYEQDLDQKRQKYLSQLSNLQLEDQYISLTQRMSELAELEAALNRRMTQCVQYEQEIEEYERFLNRRQELCNSKEDDLKKLDKDLSALHEELELDRGKLELAGFEVSKPGLNHLRRHSFNSAYLTDEDDYILKANLRKCQSQLQESKQLLADKTKKTNELTMELENLKEHQRKQDSKVKHLETQLSIYVSESHKNDSLSRLSPNISASKSSPNSSSSNFKSSKRHLNLDRFHAAELSINQEAALRRKMSGNTADCKRSNKYMQRKSSTDSGKGSLEMIALTNNNRPKTAQNQQGDVQDNQKTKAKSAICSIM